jgi:hypothetical protein
LPVYRFETAGATSVRFSYETDKRKAVAVMLQPKCLILTAWILLISLYTPAHMMKTLSFSVYLILEM